MAWSGTVGLVRLTVLNPIGRIMVLPTVAFPLFGAVMYFPGGFAAHVEWSLCSIPAVLVPGLMEVGSVILLGGSRLWW